MHCLPPLKLKNVEKPFAGHISRPDQTDFTQNPLKNAKVNVKIAESSSETYLTRKSANIYAFWCISELQGPSGRRVMADVNFHWWEARSYITRNPEFYQIEGFMP